jgi:hypothetical protein
VRDEIRKFVESLPRGLGSPVGGEFINRAVEERTRRLVEPND